jgi:hypothetical protein
MPEVSVKIEGLDAFKELCAYAKAVEAERDHYRHELSRVRVRLYALLGDAGALREDVHAILDGVRWDYSESEG